MDAHSEIPFKFLIIFIMKISEQGFLGGSFSLSQRSIWFLRLKRIRKLKEYCQKGFIFKYTG